MRCTFEGNSSPVFRHDASASCHKWLRFSLPPSLFRALRLPADGDRNVDLSNANNKSFADRRVTGDSPRSSPRKEPLQLKYSSPPTIINHILLSTGPVSAFWASSAITSQSVPSLEAPGRPASHTLTSPHFPFLVTPSCPVMLGPTLSRRVRRVGANVLHSAQAAK
jgi:hypothetical protein